MHVLLISLPLSLSRTVCTQPRRHAAHDTQAIFWAVVRHKRHGGGTACAISQGREQIPCGSSGAARKEATADSAATTPNAAVVPVVEVRKAAVPPAPSPSAQPTTTAGADAAGEPDKWDQLLAYQLLSGAVVAVAGLAVGYEPSSVRPRDWLLYWLYGGVVLPLCVGLFTAAPMYISTTEMGCIKMLEVVLAPLYGFFYEGELPATATWIGGSLLVGTLLLHSAAVLRDKRQQAPPSCPAQPSRLRNLSGRALARTQL